MKDKFKKAYMEAALVFSRLSYAKRRKVGAVIVKDDTIIGIGYNGTPPGWWNECEDNEGKTTPFVIHAEQNALDKIVRSSVSSIGAYLFVTTAPCIDCAKRILGAKIQKVYYLDEYHNKDGISFLERAGIPCEQVQLCDD